MLTFDLKQTPPSKADIEAERVRLEADQVRVKRRRLIATTLLIFLSLAVICGLWYARLLCTESLKLIAIIGISSGISSIIFSDIISSICIGVVAGATTGAVTVFLSFVGFGFTGALTVGGISGVIAGISYLVYEPLKRKDFLLVSENKNNIFPLSFLDEGEHQHRCPAILEACKQDMDCEAYRANVAKMGRALTIAEADMIEGWVNGVEVRQSMRSNR